jgi:hypothetical protein
MTDQGNEPTRVDLPPTPPTQVGMPPVPPGGQAPPPQGRPPDRRPWILAALMAAIALVAVVLLLVDDEDDDVATDASTTTSLMTTTTSESTTTTEATTTTSETTTTTTPPVSEAPPVTADPAQCAEAGSDPGDPEPAALAVFQSWERGDEACAQVLMTGDAFDELFSRDGSGATDVFQGCTEQADPDPHVDCAFTYEGGATHYLLQFSPTDGWQVFDVTQVAD